MFEYSRHEGNTIRVKLIEEEVDSLELVLGGITFLLPVCGITNLEWY